MSNKKKSKFEVEIEASLLKQEETWRAENYCFNAIYAASDNMESELDELGIQYVPFEKDFLFHENLCTIYHPVFVNCDDCYKYLFTMIVVIVDPDVQKHITFSDADEYFGLETRGLVTVYLPADLIRADSLGLIIQKVKIVCAPLLKSHQCYEFKD